MSISNSVPFNGTFTINYPEESINVHSWSLQVRFRVYSQYQWNFVLLGKNESRPFFSSQSPSTWKTIETGGLGYDSLSELTENSL